MVSRTRCGILHAAPQSRDRTKRRRLLRPRLCSAPLRKGYALRCVRGTRTLVLRMKLAPAVTLPPSSSNTPGRGNPRRQPASAGEPFPQRTSTVRTGRRKIPCRSRRRRDGARPGPGFPTDLSSTNSHSNRDLIRGLSRSRYDQQTIISLKGPNQKLKGSLEGSGGPRFASSPCCAQSLWPRRAGRRIRRFPVGGVGRAPSLRAKRSNPECCDRTGLLRRKCSSQ
jgi:hypothetical protein